jgi:hypothetical protein
MPWNHRLPENCIPARFRFCVPLDSTRFSPLTGGVAEFGIHTPIDSAPERINLRRTAKETAG